MPWLAIQKRVIETEHVSMVEIIPYGRGVSDNAAVIFVGGGGGRRRDPGTRREREGNSAFLRRPDFGRLAAGAAGEMGASAPISPQGSYPGSATPQILFEDGPRPVQPWNTRPSRFLGRRPLFGESANDGPSPR